MEDEKQGAGNIRAFNVEDVIDKARKVNRFALGADPRKKKREREREKEKKEKKIDLLGFYDTDDQEN